MIRNNSTLHQLGKAKLIEYWDELTTDQQLVFKRLYSHEDLGESIQDIVNKMPVDKIDHAIFQCETSIRKNKQH